MMYNLKWTNKFSGETGYVQKISLKEKHFVNTFAQDAAKRYNSLKLVENDLKLLSQYGEDVNNTFEAVEIG